MDKIFLIYPTKEKKQKRNKRIKNILFQMKRIVSSKIKHIVLQYDIKIVVKNETYCFKKYKN